MIRGRCPICAKTFELGSLDELPSFPFCSDRCRLVDLGRWIDGTYALPTAEPPPHTPEASPGAPPPEDEEE